MTWSEDNSVFIYEVDRIEAFAPPFDGKGASSPALLDEVYRRAKMDRSQIEASVLVQAVLRAILSLQPTEGDAVCELGMSTGWLLLRLALDSTVSRLFGVSSRPAYVEAAKRAHELLEELAPGRVPWYRRVDFLQPASLEEYIFGEGGGALPRA